MILRKSSLLAACLLMGTLLQTSSAQEISKKMLAGFQADYNRHPRTAILNAVSNTNVRNLIVNRSRVGKLDHHFAVKLDIKGITNQYSTGRCWLFTSLNVLRQQVRKQFNLSEFEFSQNYTFFFDQLEKANLFLEGVINSRKQELDSRRVEWLFKGTIGDGGIWNMMTRLTEKYGLVPKSVMPETYHSKSTAFMRKILKLKLREQGLQLRKMYSDGRSVKDMRKEKAAMLSDIYQILVVHLGVPPVEFSWRYKDKDGKISDRKNWTPLEFYKAVIAVDFADYIMLMNDPSRDFYKLYEIDYDRNMVDGPNWKYLNLPNNELKKFAKNSLLDGEAMYFSCDVGKQLDRKGGILDVEQYDYESLYGMKFGMNKKERIQSFASGSSHGMALVGMDTTANGTVTKWLLENSWGSSAGHKGYLTMTDRWFDEYGFRLVVLKKYITADVLKILKQKPILLKPWDHMF